MNPEILVAQVTGHGGVQLFDARTRMYKRTVNIQGISAQAVSAVVTGDVVVVTHVNGGVTTYNASTGSYKGMLPGGLRSR